MGDHYRGTQPSLFLPRDVDPWLACLQHMFMLYGNLLLQADFKSQELPLARIKKIMKLDDDVKVGLSVKYENRISMCLYRVYCFTSRSTRYGLTLKSLLRKYSLKLLSRFTYCLD